MGKYTQPLFLDSHIKWESEMMDKWTFKKGPIDVVDGPLYKFTFSQINKAVSDDVPDDLKPAFHKAMDLVIAGDYDDAGAAVIEDAIILINDSKLKESTKSIVIGVLTVIQGVLAEID